MATVRQKSFVGPIAYFGPSYFGKSLNQCRDVIRRRAQDFINGEIGPDCVISVAEHAMTFGPFSVVVWYRDEGPGYKPYETDDDLE